MWATEHTGWATGAAERVPVTIMTTRQRRVPRPVALTCTAMVPVTVPAASASPQR